MKCPKCGTDQADAAQCASCGIYIEKYAAYLAHKEAQQRAALSTASERRSPASLAIFAGAGLALLGLGWFVLAGSRDKEPEPTLAAVVERSPDPIDQEPPAGSVRARLEASHPPKNEIERARNATVFIETEWGASGSGFIVDSACRVITNRHVVEFDSSSLRKEVISSDEVQAAYLQRRQALMIEIQRLQVAFQEALQMGGSSTELQELRDELQRLGSELDTLSENVRAEIDEKISDEAWKYKDSALTVTLVDGTEYSVRNAQSSEHYDLAAFTIDGIDCPFLAAGDPEELAQGGQLFTIGNPSGLTWTVTSGVFSGFREEDGRRFLQTDAPINPGNSGGPLIDPQGRVVGINTMVLRDSQGIGFSIPVTAIDEAF
ncbi:trypsin-like peptidase domain-containing protein [Dokdonella sp.]|uniref:trypsin-like peptidase domain-containing protein n=1 Tax=Dokdonella sp. TaxID=2291710 RepID=UPI003528DEFC